MATFDDIPDDIKLHLFSFLSARETLNVTEVNRVNSAYRDSSQVWKMRLKQDFLTSVPKNNDLQDPKEYYKNIYPELARPVMVDMVRGMTNQSNMAANDAAQAIEQLSTRAHHSILNGNIHAAIELARQFAELSAAHCQHDAKAMVEYVYEQLFLAPIPQSQKFMHEIFKENIADDWQAEKKIADLLLYFLAAANARLSMKRLFARMPDDIKPTFLKLYGGSMIAAPIMAIDAVWLQEMIAYGIDVNSIITENERGGRTSMPIFMSAMVSMGNLLQTHIKIRNSYPDNEVELSKSKKSFQGSVSAMRTIVRTLLTKGADRDLTRTYTGIPGLLHMHEPQTARELALYFTHVISDPGFVLFTAEEIHAVKEILKMVVNDVRVELEPENDERAKCSLM